MRAAWFFRARVTVLLLVLAGVLMWAWHDVRSRRARHDWDHTLDVAIVVLKRGPVTDEALARLRARVDALDARLASEMRRYRPGGARPFAFTLLGPVDVATPAPTPDGDGFVDLARHSFAMWRYVRAVDARAGVVAGAYDSRIYLSVRPPASAERQVVEGASEQDGRIGNVDVELDPDMADLALIVAAHELFHTLGASDKYDASGHTLVPSGLAEPDRRPTFPQRYAEIMARNRPVSASEETVPETIDEMAVGAATAREIGWLK